MKTILITGATGSIGEALALSYADKNTRLILTGRNQEKLSTLAQLCEAKDAIVITNALDLTQQTSVMEWIEKMDNSYSIDLVIANAGINSTIAADGSLENFATTKLVFDVNLYGVLATIFPLIEAMKSRRQGHIAIISSLAAYRGLPQSPAYCASKAAIKVYGESLRANLSIHNVKVSVVCPGFVKSAMSDSLSGPKPFLLSAEKAALKIKNGLEKNKARIAFPFCLSFMAWLSAILPSSFTDFLLRKVNTFKS